MLNEMWSLWQALKGPVEHGKIVLDQQHPLIKPLPISERNLLCVRLTKEGKVSVVEDVADDERLGIRRIVQTNDGSFPVAKVNRPLLNCAATSEIWDALRKCKQNQRKLDLLSAALKDTSLRSWQESGWNWNSSLEKASLLCGLFDDKEKSPILEISRRFQKALRGDHTLTKQIARIALKRLQTGHLSTFRTVQELLGVLPENWSSLRESMIE